MRHLPPRIDARHWCEQRQQAESAITLDQLPRLADQVLAMPDPARAQVTGGFDGQGEPRLTLQVAAQVQLQCQRCMQPFVETIELEAAARLLNPDADLSAIDTEEDFLTLDAEGQAQVLDWIEDELLCQLPIVPKHPPEQCQAQPQTGAMAEKNGKPNPFAVLAQLKHSENPKPQE